MHINRNYVYLGGDHSHQTLFKLEHVTELAREYIEEAVPVEDARMRQMLNADETPDLTTPRHCTTKYVCPFFGHCHQVEPKHPIRLLPNLRRPLEERSGTLAVQTLAASHPAFQGCPHCSAACRQA